jgi:hypothetical protein
MPLPGGSSDKIGNRFELWWTAYCLVDVVDEQADNIFIEPPGDLGDGIEFTLIRQGVRQHHQVKRQTTKALGWSIDTLDSVLRHVPTKLRGNNDEFHFVSAMAARDLEELSTNARQAGDLNAFHSFLSSRHRKQAWSDICTLWQPSNERDCYSLLARTHVDTISEDVLRKHVLARIAAIIDGPGQQAANELVVFALDSINTSLTPHMVWNHLRRVSLSRRSWANDPHIISAVNDNNRRFLDSRKREFFRELFPQPMTGEIIKDLLGDQRIDVLVSAAAGGGKSGLLLQVIEELNRNDIPFVAIRLDRLEATLRTTGQIGAKLELPGSPVSILHAIAQSRRSVLVLDQLDAVSLISGKNPDLFDPVVDLLQEVTAFPEMRVVAACRGFDLDNDHRLKKLAANRIFKRRELSPLARSYVLQGVSDAGFDPSTLSEKQFELLANPLRLSMLAEIRPPSPRPIGLDSEIDLFDTFWKRKQQDTEQLGVTTEQFEDAIDTLCSLLEKRGALFVPDPLFIHSAGDKLASAHVLSRSDRQWSFFHETFYDFANARRLYRLNKTVTAYLKEYGQGIELRNQLRQSLAFRRAHDPALYREDLRKLLADPDVRFHLKSAATSFLGSVADPTDAEWKALDPAIDSAPGSDVTRALMTLIGSTFTWFDLARDSGAISRWLISPHPALRSLLAWVLIQVERSDPDRAVPVLREACARGVEGKQLAASVLQHSILTSSRSVFDLFLELLGEGQFTPAVSGEPRKPTAPWLKLHQIAVKKPEWACEALGVQLRQAIQTAQSLGVSNPFSSDVGILNDDQLDDETIHRMYQGAPLKFFDETWPSIVEIVAANLKGDRLRRPYRDEIWRFYDSSFSYRLHEKIIKGVTAGIRALATADFEKFSHLVNAVPALGAATIECLLVEAYASTGGDHPEESLRFLLAHTSRFIVGWHNDPEGPAQELIQRASQVCSESALLSLQTALLDWYPWWEKTHTKRRNFERTQFGYSQYRLLSSVAECRRTKQVTRRLQEWERKFGQLEKQPRSSYIGRANWARSPIPSQEAADKMTDDQWLAAIAQYPSTKFDLRLGGNTNSGLMALAEELKRVARNDLNRFVRLMRRIPKNANLKYFEAIILAAAEESVPSETALAVCKIGDELDGRPLGEWISYCLGRACSKSPSPAAVSMVCVYIDPAFPENVRHSALLNLGNLLRADPAGIEVALPHLQVSAQDVPRKLRSMFCYALTPLFGTTFQHYVSELFQPMRSADPWLPADPAIEQFLHLAFVLEHGEFEGVMEALLNIGEPEVRLMAARQAAIAALVAQDVADVTPKLISGDVNIRKGLAQVCAANVRFGRFRDYCAHHLGILFSDAEETVRAAASECFRELEGDDLADLWDLVTTFLDSPSAKSSLRSLLDCLLQSTIRHDRLTLRACEMAIEYATLDHSHYELTICRDLVLRTYHQAADSVIREHSLDLIDQLLGLEVAGLEKALFEIENRR